MSNIETIALGGILLLSLGCLVLTLWVVDLSDRIKKLEAAK